MSKSKLKTEFIKKTNFNQSEDFDKRFFKKLTIEKESIKVFNPRKWLTYAFSSALTMGVVLLLVNINQEQLAPKNYNEYRQSILETQIGLDEDMSDLTEDVLDEI